MLNLGFSEDMGIYLIWVFLCLIYDFREVDFFKISGTSTAFTFSKFRRHLIRIKEHIKAKSTISC
jgi:hypothetical protein